MEDFKNKPYLHFRGRIKLYRNCPSQTLPHPSLFVVNFLEVDSPETKMCVFFRQLVECGANIDAENEIRETPLYYAAEQGHVRAIETLVELKADMEKETEDGLRPIHAAARANKEAVHTLIKLGASHEGLKYIIRTKTQDILQILSEALEKVDDVDSFNQFHNFVGEYENSIFSKRTKNVPFFQFITDLGMLRERELVMEIVHKVRYFKYQLDSLNQDYLQYNEEDETEEVRKQVIKELKCASKTTTGLAIALESAEKRFSWSWSTFIVKSMISTVVTVVGFGTYILDVYTDLDFARTLHQHSIGEDDYEDGTFQNCTAKFDENFKTTFAYCQSSSQCYGTQGNKTIGIKILRGLRSVDKKGRDCFEDGDRFGAHSSSWDQAVYITIGHCVLPLVFTIIIWVVLTYQLRKFRLLNLPLPFIAASYQTGCQIRLNRNEMRNKYEQEFNMEKQMEVNAYQRKKDYLLRKMEINTAMVNLSTMIESSLEATFQGSFKLCIQCHHNTIKCYIEFLPISHKFDFLRKEKLE